MHPTVQQSLMTSTANVECFAQHSKLSSEDGNFQGKSNAKHKCLLEVQFYCICSFQQWERGIFQQCVSVVGLGLTDRSTETRTINRTVPVISHFRVYDLELVDLKLRLHNQKHVLDPPAPSCAMKWKDGCGTMQAYRKWFAGWIFPNKLFSLLLFWIYFTVIKEKAQGLPLCNQP